MKTSIWWIRRDLRLEDNQALQAATAAGDQTLPVFILDPTLLESNKTAEKRLAFLCNGLRTLGDELSNRGSRLVLQHGDPQEVLTRLVEEISASNIFAEQDYSPYAIRRDERIAKYLPLTTVQGLTVHHPAAIRKADGAPYTVYTPFSRAWKALPLPEAAHLLPAPDVIHTPDKPVSDPHPSTLNLPKEISVRAGEVEAARRLNAFVEGEDALVTAYADARNRMDLQGTSQLSPFLRFGMLSARQAVVAALGAIESAASEQARRGAETWLNELIWREFYIAILYHFPHVLERSFRAAYDRIPWQNDKQAFEAWCEGRTGYPLVDAAMRQLRQSGWMHNRARMIAASFLVKNLLIDWRWGERWFMRHLIDGDPAANNGGWQWTAGTGTDAAPYFRIFNPVLQSKKFDPHGDYIRRWVSELQSVEGIVIHEPWNLSKKEPRSQVLVNGETYPVPFVDLRSSRERALAAYASARDDSKDAL